MTYLYVGQRMQPDIFFPKPQLCHTIALGIWNSHFRLRRSSICLFGGYTSDTLNGCRVKRFESHGCFLKIFDFHLVNATIHIDEISLTETLKSFLVTLCGYKSWDYCSKKWINRVSGLWIFLCSVRKLISHEVMIAKKAFYCLYLRL